ncbi:MAG: hypothetical protein GY861_23120 [bacterium]|nr:hypothetical protein [bacterium]
MKLILNSAKYDKVLDSTSIKQIQDQKTVIGGVENLIFQLKEDKDSV